MAPSVVESDVFGKTVAHVLVLLVTTCVSTESAVARLVEFSTVVALNFVA